MKLQRIENVVIVTSDGGIAHSDIKDGHIIPVVVVDCAHHPALIDVCLIQEHTPPGDVHSVWMWDLLDRRHVYLRLNFEKPVKTTTSIRFDVRTQGGLVTGIMAAHAFYLQPSAFAAKVSEGLNSSKILIEIPFKVTPPNWEKNFEEQLVKRYKKRGYDKAQAKQAAMHYMQRAKETWTLRAPHGRKDRNISSDPSKTVCQKNL